MSRMLRGVWLEVRVIPVLLWSFSAITLGTAVAVDGGELHGGLYVGAILLGVLIQGLLAHCVNELEDWRSGTDQYDSPRVISGGSKVLLNGLLSHRGLLVLFAVAFAATTVLGLAMVASRGLVMLPFGLAGVLGAVCYTMPPVRAAYRPLAGELVAFTCLALCVIGAAVLQHGTVDAELLLVAAAVAALRGGDADGAPLPRPRRRPGRRPAEADDDRRAGAAARPPLRDRLVRRRAGLRGRRVADRAAAAAARGAATRWVWRPTSAAGRTTSSR